MPDAAVDVVADATAVAAGTNNEQAVTIMAVPAAAATVAALTAPGVEGNGRGMLAIVGDINKAQNVEILRRQVSRRGRNFG